MRYVKPACLSLVVLFALSAVSLAATYTDSKDGFRIERPDNWKSKSYKDGSDRLFDMMSPDRNVLVRVRAIKIPSGKNINHSQIQAFYQKKKVSGISPYLSKDVTINGVTGKAYFYHWKYNNIPVNVVAWITIVPGKVYIISRIIPEALVKKRAKQANILMSSFKTAVNNRPQKPAKRQKPIITKKANKPDKSKDSVPASVIDGIWTGGGDEKIFINIEKQEMSIPFGGQNWKFTIKEAITSGPIVSLKLALSEVLLSPPDNYPEVLLEADRTSAANQAKRYENKFFLARFAPGAGGACYLKFSFPGEKEAIGYRLEKQL